MSLLLIEKISKTVCLRYLSNDQMKFHTVGKHSWLQKDA